MRYVDIINDIKHWLGDYSTNTATAIETAVNGFYLELMALENWWFARQELSFDTIAKYTTGTVTVTNASATVTGLSTSFTYKMIGRRLIVGSDNRSYMVKSVSSSTVLTLDTVYQGTGGSGQSYAIYADTYRINDQAMKCLHVWNYDGKLQEIITKRFNTAEPNVTCIGTPTNYCQRGQTTTTYDNTGLISIANGSASITGSSTAFDSDMVGMVIKVVGDGNEYVISAVGSVSDLTIDEVFDGTTNASATYQISPPGVERIRLYPMPQTVDQIKYTAILRPPKLKADNDIPKLPEQWHYGLVLGACYRLRYLQTNEKYRVTLESDYEKFITKMRQWHFASEDESPYFSDNDNQHTVEDRNWWVFRENE